MEKLGQLVQNLAVIIIITTFLELLVPNSKMGRYIQLFLGLFIIVMILNPVLNFLDGSKNLDFFSWAGSNGSDQLETILAEGKISQKRTVRKQWRFMVKTSNSRWQLLLGLYRK
ncbi:MAG TPA: stage III sporulation protein AF [Peptococcaceae bacterium]|nr:stage III sporulation protein AF [Peptococcaceae bacterium]